MVAGLLPAKGENSWKYDISALLYPSLNDLRSTRPVVSLAGIGG